MSEDEETEQGLGDGSLVVDQPAYTYWRIGLAVIFILVPLVNFGVSAFPESQSRFADDAQTRVNAAGYAFAIWGVIFTGMILFSARLLFGNEASSRDLLRAIICLSIAGVASILFVPISIYGDQVLSWLDILLHLIPLAFANYYLRKHARIHQSTTIGRWTFFGPSMYFGWICAATVISTALMANQLGIEVGDAVATPVTLLVVAGLGGVGIWLTLVKDPIYGATVAWALVAVGVEQQAYPTIRIVAWVIASAVAIAIAFRFLFPPRFYAVDGG